MPELCQICEAHEWQERHHRKRRSQGGTDEPVNLLYICRVCHAAVHADPAIAYQNGWLVKSWDVVMPLASQWHLEPGAEQEPTRAGELPSPGTSCPTCKRRVPHKKKDTSPKSKVFSCRVPIDDAVTFHDMLESAARHMELYETPHWQYWTLLHALVLALQTPRADG